MGAGSSSAASQPQPHQVKAHGNDQQEPTNIPPSHSSEAEDAREPIATDLEIIIITTFKEIKQKRGRQVQHQPLLETDITHSSPGDTAAEHSQPPGNKHSNTEG